LYYIVTRIIYSDVLLSSTRQHLREKDCLTSALIDKSDSICEFDTS